MYKPDEVLEKYDKAIFKVANTYYNDNPRFSYEDLLSEARVAAVKACQSYEEGSDASFFTFLTSAMNNEVQKFVKNNSFDLKVTEHQQRKEFKESGDIEKIKKEAKAVSIDAKPTKGNSDEWEKRTLNQFIPSSGDLSPDIAMEKQESIQILREEMASLPNREREVLYDRWLEGKTLEQIAGAFGVTKQTIHGWEKKGFERLQKRVIARLGRDE